MCYGSGVRTPAQIASPSLLTDEARLPLVLLPGTLCDHRVFEPMLAALQAAIPGLTTQVLPISGSDSCCTIPEVATDLLEHAPERFALLGFSLGGIVALHLAAQAAERVCGLALLDSTASPVPESQHSVRRAQAAHASTLGLRAYLQQHLWPDYVAANRQGDTDLQEQLHLMASTLGIDVLHRQTELALIRPDARPLLASLDMPTLVVAGEDDRLCRPETQRSLAEALPNATLALIPHAGHFALMEKPDTVAVHVAAWFHTLARRDPAAKNRASEETK